MGMARLQGAQEENPAEVSKDCRSWENSKRVARLYEH